MARKQTSIPVFTDRPDFDDTCKHGEGREKFGRGRVFWSDGTNYWSYNTCIAARDGDRLILNITPYSATTVEHRRGFEQLIATTAWRDANRITEFVEVDGLGFNVSPQDLIAKADGRIETAGDE